MTWNFPAIKQLIQSILMCFLRFVRTFSQKVARKAYSSLSIIFVLTPGSLTLMGNATVLVTSVVPMLRNLSPIELIPFSTSPMKPRPLTRRRETGFVTTFPKSISKSPAISDHCATWAVRKVVNVDLSSRREVIL